MYSYGNNIFDNAAYVGHMPGAIFVNNVGLIINLQVPNLYSKIEYKMYILCGWVGSEFFVHTSIYSRYYITVSQ